MHAVQRTVIYLFIYLLMDRSHKSKDGVVKVSGIGINATIKKQQVVVVVWKEDLLLTFKIDEPDFKLFLRWL